MDILVVDDEIDICEILTSLLEDQGYQAIHRQDAESALRAIQEHDPALLISDITMPGMNGLQLIEKLKAQDSFIAVVMLTAHGESKTVIQALQLGAIDYVVKPFDSNELTEKLSGWVEIGRRLKSIANETTKDVNVLKKQLRMIELFRLKNKSKSTKSA